MKRHTTRIEVPNRELEAISDELNRAQQTINCCYARLEKLGLTNIAEKPPVETGDDSGAIKTTVQKSIRDTIQEL